MKKTLQIMIPLLLAAASVFSERYYLHEVQQPGFVQDALVSMTRKLELFQSGIKEKIQEGFFHKYLILENISSDQIAQLFEAHPLAGGVTVFNPDLHIMSATHPDYPLSQAIETLERVRKERREILVVTEKGIEIFFPILWGGEPEGFVSVLYPAFGVSDETIPFICSLTREDLYLGGEKSLSFGERELLKEKLRLVQMQAANHATVKLDKSYDVYWQYDPDLKIYYGQISLAAPFWSYLSFYIVLFLSGTLLVLLISSRPQKEEELDSLEASLQKNRETLARLAQNLHHISQLPDHLNTLSSEKIVERAETGLPESKQPAKVYEPGGHVEYPRAMDFVLFDPLDRNWQTISPVEPEPAVVIVPEEIIVPEEKILPEEVSMGEEELEEKAAQLRKRAFSSELLELMEEISHPVETEEEELTEAEDLAEAVALFHEDLQNLSINPFGESLRNLYSREVTGEDIEPPMAYIRKEMRADALLLVVFDKNQGCYIPSVINGLDDSWKENLFLLHNDNVIPFDPGEPRLLEVTSEKKESLFLKKRFSQQNFDELGALYLFPMHPYRARAAVIGIYCGDPKQKYLQARYESVDVKKVERYLRELAPAVAKLEEKIGGYHAQEHFKTVINELKGTIAIDHPETTVLHAEPIIPIDISAYEKIEKLCVPMLKNGERLLFVHPAHLVILLKRPPGEDHGARNSMFIDLVQSVTQDVIWRIVEYPENGKNLFSYF